MSWFKLRSFFLIVYWIPCKVGVKGVYYWRGEEICIVTSLIIFSGSTDGNYGVTPYLFQLY